MSRESAKARREREGREANFLRCVHYHALRGVAACASQERHAATMVAQLENPRGHYTGSKHAHAEPFDAPGCGWCSNVHSWRHRLLEAKLGGQVALGYAQRIRELAAALPSGAALWAAVQADEELRGTRRELVRDLWAQERAARAADALAAPAGLV